MKSINFGKLSKIIGACICIIIIAVIAMLIGLHQTYNNSKPKYPSNSVKLKSPLPVMNAANANAPSTVPANQHVQYKNKSDGIEIWNKKFPKNRSHMYIIVTSRMTFFKNSEKSKVYKFKNHNNKVVA